MHASGTPTPPPERQQPAARTAAGASWRILAVVLALALAFACAVMIVAMSDIGSTPTCEDVLSGDASLPADNECFDGSSTQKTISLVLGWPSGILAGIAALLALGFVFTGRRGRLVLQLTGAAVVLGGLSILIGSI